MKMLQRGVFVFCTFAILLLWTCLASAKDHEAKPVLRAVYADFPPYSFTDEEGAARGYSVELTLLIAGLSGYDVRFISASNPKQFFEMMARDEADITPLLGFSEARQALGNATSPLGQFELSAYVRQDSDITSLSDLSGRRIGAVAGAATQSAAEMIPNGDVVVLQGNDSLLLLLINGELDAVVGVAEPFDARLKNADLKGEVRRLNQSIMITPYGFYINPARPEVYNAFERAISEKVTPQSLAVLRERWFGEDLSVFEHPWFRNVALIVGGISLMAISLGIYSWRLRYRSVQLLAKSGANKLLINALDHIRAGVVIFDREMRAVHWNEGFEGRFPTIVPMLREGATLKQFMLFAYREEVVFTDLEPQELTVSVTQLVADVRRGNSRHEIVRTPQGDTFDRTVFRLGARHYAAIWVDVSEIHNQQERILQQGRELERKNQQLLAFSAMAAHDMKGPLAQQSALLEFFFEDLDDANITLPEETKGLLDTLTELTVKMRVLVGDLLEFAKADTPQASPKDFLPNDRLSSLVRLVGEHQGFAIDTMAGLPAVRVDPKAFDLVMRNLISNGVKHHDRASGQITVRGYQTDTTVTIEVEDDGPGISEAEVERVFEPFCRLTTTQGSGLGLAFVKSTVQSWGGGITIRKAPQRGCIFALTLPAAHRARVEHAAQ